MSGNLCMFIHNPPNFITRNDLNKNTKNIESLSVELINKNSKNSIISTISFQRDHFNHFNHRPPQGETNPFDNFLRDLYSHGDFNLNILDYNNNDEVKKILK